MEKAHSRLYGLEIKQTFIFNVCFIQQMVLGICNHIGTVTPRFKGCS